MMRRTALAPSLRIALLAVMGLVGPTFLGCRSPAYAPSGDPLMDLRNPNLFEGERGEAAKVAWGEVQAGVRDRARTRQALKDLAWSQQSPVELRLTVLDLLLSDTDPSGEADSKRMAGLMLPSEPSRAVRVLLSDAIGGKGWTELTPAVVRSLSGDFGGVEEAQRPELESLRRLHPGKSVEEVVYGVFLDPTGGAVSASDASSLRLPERTRADAWALLSRLDPSGERRQALLATAGADGDGVVEDLRACWRELACMPDTAMELDWLGRLRGRAGEEQRKANAAWWAEASRAVARLGAEQRVGLELRHCECVRWASVHRPGWVTSKRQELMATLEERLNGRERFMRTAEMSAQRAGSKERLRDWESSIAWGDALAMLVIDEALATPGLSERLFEQVGVDRQDRKSEYGGVIEAAQGGAGEGFQLVLFRPRARDRSDDNRFVTSEDMLRYSDRALAHYHQHVQNARNAKFAGPSDGDLDHARRSGRSCVVFTSVDGDRLNADYYQPNGAVIDLGVLRAR